MNLEQGVVQRTTRNLEEKFLLRTQEGNKVEKYIQRLCNTPMAKWQFNSAEYSIVTLLLLRGPQTPGELRSRAGRLHTFDDNQTVMDTLLGLMNREDGALVSRLPRKAGRQDHEYMHLFSGEIESVVMEVPIPVSSAPQREDKIEKLEARVTQLEAALITLADKLGESVVFGEVEPPS
jgi:uncharacterized protein YceH (UPF0502 family)